MAIYLPQTVEEELIALDELTPREIVAELDKYVVGQHDAKRAVAIALRNRMRRQKLSPEMAEEVMPKNIIMIGPTGVGKTEIARRLAKLANSPFLKVEASKFTEVGYVGRDVESMIRDLIEIAIDMVREEKLEDVADKAEMNAEERILDLLLPPSPATAGDGCGAAGGDGGGWNAGGGSAASDEGDRAARHPGESHSRTREKLRQQLREGKLDERTVELDVREKNMPAFEIISNQGIEDMDINFKDMLPNIFGQRTKKRKMKVSEAFEYLIGGRRAAADRHGPGDQDGAGPGGAERHHLSGRDRQDRRTRERTRARRLARGRAAGHSADRGRDDDQHALRDAAHRSHSVHRGRGVPCIEAERSDSRAAGALSDPGGAEVADGGGFCKDSDRAEVVADQAVRGAAGDRGTEAGVHHRRAGGDCDLRRQGQRDDGKHRSAAAAHHHGAGAG